MEMYKEAYERLNMDVTRFDVEDVITTSGEHGGGGTTPPPFVPGDWEMPIGP